jgi:protein arginine kinase
MDFATLKDAELKWLDGSGPWAAEVVSSRVRLARNLRGHRFPHNSPTSELTAIREEICRKVKGRKTFTSGCCLLLKECSPGQRSFLLERHLASPDIIRHFQHSALLISADVSRVVMVNEEDHLRAQVFRAGFDPVGVCHDALDLDDEMEEDLEYAFSEDWGYLTACPTNVGTGFRLSVLVHLPGLVLTNEIDKILNSLRQLQFSVRGLFGEGSAVQGALFQISNLGTLGRSEEDLTDDFSHHVSKVLQYEKLSREKLLEKDGDGIRDIVHRSHAIMRAAHVVTSREAFDRLSDIRMGVSLGILPDIPMGALNRALVEMQPAPIQVRAGRLVKGRERAAIRAAYFRAIFA